MSDPSPRRPSGSQPLADLVGKALDPVLARQGFGAADIISNWEEIVGERLAAACVPIRLHWPPRGTRSSPEDAARPATLFVRVEGAFALELQHVAPVLCGRINTRLGWRCVGRIAMKQGPVAERPERRYKPPKIVPEAAREAARLVADIVDDNLRKALERLGSRALGGPAKS